MYASVTQHSPVINNVIINTIDFCFLYVRDLPPPLYPDTHIYILIYPYQIVYIFDKKHPPPTTPNQFFFY